MNSQIKTIDPLTFQDWDEYISTLKDVTFFHTANWARTVAESYNYKITYFVLERNQKAQALIPLMETPYRLLNVRAVALPFSDYCFPLYHDREEFQQLLLSAVDYGKQMHWKFIEIRGGVLPGKFKTQEYHLHQVILNPDIDETFRSLRKSTRQNILKAYNSKLETTFCDDLNSIREFYRLHCMNRKKLGVPPQPFKFFKNVFQNIIRENKGEIVLVSHSNKVISAGITFYHNGTVIFKYVANDHKYLGFRPNNLMIWEMFKSYTSRGYSKFCFGKTELYSNGLRQFKRGFSTVETLLPYYKLNLPGDPDFSKHLNSDVSEQGLTPANSRNTKPKYQSILKFLPIGMVRIIGELFYRHSS